MCSIFSIDPLPRLAIEKKYLSVDLGGRVLLLCAYLYNLRDVTNLPVEDTSGVINIYINLKINKKLPSIF